MAYLSLWAGAAEYGSFSVHVQHHVQVLGEQMKGLEVKGHLESHEFMIRTFEWRLHLGNALSCLLLPRDSDAIKQVSSGYWSASGSGRDVSVASVVVGMGSLLAGSP